MISVPKALEALGQVAQKQELLRAGVTSKQLSWAVAAGAAFRVRKGWYALPTASCDLVRAVRVGGRLACVSAAEAYGWATPPGHGLHVSLPPNASRMRKPDDKTAPMPAESARDVSVILHWDHPLPGERQSRLITSPFETVRQIALCQPPEMAVAAFDSFLRVDPAGSCLLEDWLSELPDSVLRELALRSDLCHSFLESIGRIRLTAHGITGEHQVQICGVGRVDMVIDGWLVIEWDGLAHHDDPGAHDEDCRRDAELAALGYRCLRFTYNLVMYNWPLVLDAIRAVLAGVTVA